MSRALSYWNDETISFIRKNFIAVAVPTWTARAEGREGEFLRRAGLHNQWITSSGYMHCVSADGSLLGRRATPEVLEAFARLPGSVRRPGAVRVPDLDPSEALVPSPPEDGLVMLVHARFLGSGTDGSLRPAHPRDFPLMADQPGIQQSWRLFLEPNTECMWLKSEEWQALVPARPVVGSRLDLGPAILQRLVRFHLNPKRATTSEGGIVPPQLVKTARAELVVESVSPAIIRMRLEGRVHWGSDYDAPQATTPDGPLPMGFQSTLLGEVEYDREKNRFTRFDLVVPGEVWGRWGDANGKSMYVERPGRSPFGFALELAPGKSPTERIPPGGNSRYLSERTGYFSTTKP